MALGFACAQFEGNDTMHPLGSPDVTLCGLKWNLNDVGRAMEGLGIMEGIDPEDPRMCDDCMKVSV